MRQSHMPTPLVFQHADHRLVETEWQRPSVRKRLDPRAAGMTVMGSKRLPYFCLRKTIQGL